MDKQCIYEIIVNGAETALHGLYSKAIEINNVKAMEEISIRLETVEMIKEIFIKKMNGE